VGCVSQLAPPPTPGTPLPTPCGVRRNHGASSLSLRSGGIAATVDALNAAGVGAMRRAAAARVASVKKLKEKARGEVAAERAGAGAAAVAAAANRIETHVLLSRTDTFQRFAASRRGNPGLGVGGLLTCRRGHPVGLCTLNQVDP
jgi:hypothetical protein